MGAELALFDVAIRPFNIAASRHSSSHHPFLTMKPWVSKVSVKEVGRKSSSMTIPHFRMFLHTSLHIKPIRGCCCCCCWDDPDYAVLTPFACSQSREGEKKGREGKQGEGAGKDADGRREGVAKRSGICTHIARPTANGLLN